jgi:hypothetical protein
MRKFKSQSLTLKDAYQFYAKSLLKQNPEWWGKYDQKMPNYRIFEKVGTKIIERASYPRYRATIEAWFKGAQDYIINGWSLRLGASLGRISPRRAERNPKNKQVNWAETTSMWKEKGERKGLVYHTDDDWVRIGWDKGRRTKNEYLYEFDPAEGNTKKPGFKQRFSQANQDDQLLKLKYKYYPLYD